MEGWRELRDQALSALAQQTKPDARAAAARELLRLFLEDDVLSADASAIWTRLLSDNQEEVRRVGIQIAVQFLSAEDSGRLLCSSANDKSPLVRVQVAGSIADLERPSCRETLRALLGDAVPSVRFEAARGLAAIGDGSGVEVLIEALRVDELCFRALGSLADLGDARAIPAIRALFHRLRLPAYERAQAAGALAKMGELEGAHYLLKRTRKRWTIDRAFAIELCGEVKAPGAFERLVEILGDDQDPCRGAAARGLGRLRDPRAMGPLLAVIEDPSQGDDLRLDAAEGICLLGDSGAHARIEALVPSLKSAEARNDAKELLEEYA